MKSEKKMWKNSSLVKMLIVLASIFIVIGCGGGGGGGDEASIYDATGTWEMKSVQTYDSYDSLDNSEDTDIVTITQSGNTFSIEGYDCTGNVNGNEYNINCNTESSNHNISFNLTSENTFEGEDIVTGSEYEEHWLLEGTKQNAEDSVSENTTELSDTSDTGNIASEIWTGNYNSKLTIKKLSDGTITAFGDWSSGSVAYSYDEAEVSVSEQYFKFNSSGMSLDILAGDALGGTSVFGLSAEGYLEEGKIYIRYIITTGEIYEIMLEKSSGTGVTD